VSSVNSSMSRAVIVRDRRAACQTFSTGLSTIDWNSVRLTTPCVDNGTRFDCSLDTNRHDSDPCGLKSFSDQPREL
jgi:hypothetical protein